MSSIQLGDKLIGFKTTTQRANWDGFLDLISHNSKAHKLLFKPGFEYEDCWNIPDGRKVIVLSHGFCAFKAFPDAFCPISAVEVIPGEIDCFCSVRDLWTFGHRCGKKAP